MTDVEQGKVKTGPPIEVILMQRPTAGIACMVVRPDESTTDLEITSLSMHAAKREITGWLVHQGYQPLGRWAPTVDAIVDPVGGEVVLPSAEDGDEWSRIFADRRVHDWQRGI